MAKSFTMESVIQTIDRCARQYMIPFNQSESYKKFIWSLLKKCKPNGISSTMNLINEVPN